MRQDQSDMIFCKCCVDSLSLQQTYTGDFLCSAMENVFRYFGLAMEIGVTSRTLIS